MTASVAVPPQQPGVLEWQVLQVDLALEQTVVDHRWQTGLDCQSC